MINNNRCFPDARTDLKPNINTERHIARHILNKGLNIAGVCNYNYLLILKRCAFYSN